MDKKPTEPLPMPIRTPRLVIFPTALEYAEELHQAKIESVNELKNWMLWAKNPPDIQKDRELMLEKQADFILRKDMQLMAFTHEGRLVVSTGLHRLEWAVPRCEIGYWCRTPDQGKGYVTETANALTRYAFEVLKMRKVMIGMDTENKASEAVAKRLNFVHEFDDIGGLTIPDCDDVRTKRVYSCFDPATLPALDVSW